MTLAEFIEKYGQSATYLAKQINMPKSTFNNKLKGNDGARFTGPEEVAIMQVIADMGKEFINFTKTA